MISLDEKLCGKCGKEKSLSELHRQGNRYQYMCKNCMKLYCLANKNQRRARSIVWNKNNKERRKAAKKKWQEENREEILAYSRQYYLDHKELHNSKGKAWAKNNPEKRKAAKHRRRALENNANAERFLDVEIFERDGWACGICGDLVDKELKYPHPMSKSLDHIVPISKGGSHTRNNTQCSHIRCNKRKYNSTELNVAI